MRTLKTEKISLSLKEPFRISRGVKTAADLVRVKISEGDHEGAAECCPYPRYGETQDSVIHQISGVRKEIESGLDLQKLPTLLPAGAARNALDCALLDLEAKKLGRPVYEKFGLTQRTEFITMQTISIGLPKDMAEKAQNLPKGTPLKVKLDQELVLERLAAIQKAAPVSPILVDANEAWTADLLDRVMRDLKALGVVLIEQPLPAGADEDLREIRRLVPVLADEACHTSADLPDLVGKYDAVNIKLDKTGGLSEAVHLLKAAKDLHFQIMVGCMVSSSLSIAPISLLCSHADFIDLDAPLFLKNDPDQAMTRVKGCPKVKFSHPWGR